MWWCHPVKRHCEAVQRGREAVHRVRGADEACSWGVWGRCKPPRRGQGEQLLEKFSILSPQIPGKHIWNTLLSQQITRLLLYMTWFKQKKVMNSYFSWIDTVDVDVEKRMRVTTGWGDTISAGQHRKPHSHCDLIKKVIFSVKLVGWHRWHPILHCIYWRKINCYGWGEILRVLFWWYRNTQGKIHNKKVRSVEKNKKSYLD